jgi:hypothetical protein
MGSSSHTKYRRFCWRGTAPWASGDRSDQNSSDWYTRSSAASSSGASRSAGRSGTGTSRRRVATWRATRDPRGVGAERGPRLAAHDRGVGEQAVERRQREELGGALVADAGDPGDAVDLVAGEREQLGHAVGQHPELAAHGLGVVQDLGRRIEPPHVGADELGEVLVAGDDPHVVARGGGLRGERREDVVGLGLGAAHDEEAVRNHQLVQPRQLRAEVVGHGRAAALVAGELGLAARRAGGGVEHDGAEGGALAGEQLAERLREAVQRVRGQPAGGAEVVGDGVPGPVQEPEPVDEHGALTHGTQATPLALKRP